jgi:hypothetical protein
VEARVVAWFIAQICGLWQRTNELRSMMQRYSVENATQVPLLYGLADHWADMLGVWIGQVNERSSYAKGEALSDCIRNVAEIQKA